MPARMNSRIGRVAVAVAAAAVVCAAGVPCFAQETGATAGRERTPLVAAPRESAAGFPGNYKSETLTLQLHAAGIGRDGSNNFVGTLTIGAEDYLIAARQQGNSLEGTFGSINGRERFKFAAKLDVDTLTLTSDGEVFILSRDVPAKVNPLKGKANAAQPDGQPEVRISVMPPGEDSVDRGPVTIRRIPSNDDHGPVVVRDPDGVFIPAEGAAIAIGGAEGAAAAAERLKPFGDEAKRLRDIAVNKQDGRAAVQLGDLLAKGTADAKPDLVEAMVWYSVGDALDEPAAARKSQTMSERLTDQQLEVADSRVGPIMVEMAALEMIRRHGNLPGGPKGTESVTVLRPPGGEDVRPPVVVDGTGRGKGGDVTMPPIGDRPKDPQPPQPPQPPTTGTGVPGGPPVDLGTPPTGGPVEKFPDKEPRLPGPAGE